VDPLTTRRRPTVRAGRVPYEWDGNLDDVAVQIDGCYRSARIDRQLSALYPLGSAESIDHRRSAYQWFVQAQALERAWLRQVVAVCHE
jgi:hypothetical protein